MRLELRALVPPALFLACACCVCAEAPAFNPDDLPTKDVGNGVKVKIYQEHPWRMVDLEFLKGENGQDTDVCFEGKFERVVEPDKLKLVGYAVAPGTNEKEWASIIINDSLKKVTQSFKLNDNLWFCGTLRKPGPKYLEFVAIHIMRLVPDMQRWAQKLERLRQQRDGEGLLELGWSIKEQGKRNVHVSDGLYALANCAIEAGLTIKEEALKPDDVNSMFRLALDWREKLERTDKFRRLVEAILKIDPKHPRARQVAIEEWGWEDYEGIVRPKEEIAEIKKRREADVAAEDAKEKARREAQERERLREASNRAVLLADRESALRTADPKAREEAVAGLGEAARTCLDAGFGVEAVDILVNAPDTAAVRALCTASKNTDPTVRIQVFEALAWRGGRQDQTALDGFCEALTAEKDSDTASTAVAAAEALDTRDAAGVLVRSLDNTNSEVQKVIMDGLETVTKQQLSSKQEWQDWWNRNKGNSKLN